MHPLRSVALASAASIALAACGGAETHPWTPPTSRDTRDDPAAVRAGYCNAALHFWWPLTDAESAALAGLDQARAADAHALLALGVLASGDRRDAARYADYARRVDAFVADETAAVQGAPDDWHRGYELHRAMHRRFFSAGSGELGGYDLHQGRLTGIFDTGRYNCVSSAVLFVILARAFSMPVRGVLVPTHAFVEVGQPGGKILEVETTSDTGFDLVHDARFYRESAERWSRDRGLRPVTLEEYEHRSVVEPYRLVASAMIDQSGRPGVADADRDRLREAAAFVDAESALAQEIRVETYLAEAERLRKQNAERTIAALFDCVGPVIAEVSAKQARDAKTMRVVGWSRAYQADALLAIGRGEEAAAIAGDAVDRVDPSWEDAGALRENLYGALMDRMLDLMTRKEYAAAAAVMRPHAEGCRRSHVCASNLKVVYTNWSIDFRNRSISHQRAGDWQAARQVLQQCVATLPDDPGCRDDLAELESRHRF